MKLRFCRICGKKGIKFASDGCKYCGSPWIDNIEWQIKKREGLTEVINGIEVLRKKSSKEVFNKKEPTVKEPALKQPKSNRKINTPTRRLRQTNTNNVSKAS